MTQPLCRLVVVSRPTQTLYAISHLILGLLPNIRTNALLGRRSIIVTYLTIASTLKDLLPVMPANPQGQKTAVFWAVNIRRHVAPTFSTMLHTLISIVQTRCRKWGYIYEINISLPHAKHQRQATALRIRCGCPETSLV
jgi:hypothetical protein